MKTSLASTLALVMLAGLPLSALAAETSVGGSAAATVKVNTGLAGEAETRAKTRADAEIDRRVKNLTELSTRLSSMKRLSDSDKASLSASLTAEINALNALKAQIDAETDLAALKTEVQSITKQYRIYMLILPQARIAAAADRIKEVVGASGSLASMSTKLEARISAAGSPSDLTTLLTDMTAKMTSANASADAALQGTISLKPDNGDATVAAANKAALTDARAKIEAAVKDLKTAVGDMHAIIKGLKSLKVTATASTTPQ